MANYVIRAMTQAELEMVLGWAEQEGWRPGKVDAEYYYPTDPNGFFMGLLDGEPIGSISGVRYGSDYGFIGLYIVKPEYRQQGFGFQLWQTAMAYLHGRNIGLDGVIAQQANYQKSGFHTAYRQVRYQGTTDFRQSPPDISIIPASVVPFEQLLAYDSALYPAPRAVFLRAWLQQRYGSALVAMDGNQLMGYGVIRACHDGYRVGPLFADSGLVAEQLLSALLAKIPEGSLFFIDIPEPNSDALALVASWNMQPVFEAARMYTQEQPKINLAKIFAVTSLELG